MNSKTARADEALELYRTLRNASEVARRIGVSERTVRRWLAVGDVDAKDAQDRRVDDVVYPALVDDDLPVDKLVEIAAARSRRRLEAAAQKRSQRIRITNNRPAVIAFVGDPHLDDDGCDWDRLLGDVALLRSEHCYAVNVGDTTNNWTGRLMRLYAAQEASRKTARKFARWFLTETGVRWLVWIMGNHDEWESGADILRLMNGDKIVMEDWSARFTVEWENGFEVPFWVAHDFPGSSQWNRMHGLMKAAMMKGGAGVYAAGHRHTPGLHWEPMEDRDSGYWALRSKGYKAIDSHAVRLGHGHVDEGHTTAVVVDPRIADARDAIQGFKSLRAAVAYRNAID